MDTVDQTQILERVEELKSVVWNETYPEPHMKELYQAQVEAWRTGFSGSPAEVDVAAKKQAYVFVKTYKNIKSDRTMKKDFGIETS